MSAECDKPEAESRRTGRRRVRASNLGAELTVKTVAGGEGGEHPGAPGHLPAVGAGVTVHA